MDLDRTLLEIGGSPVTLLHLLLVAALAGGLLWHQALGLV